VSQPHTRPSSNSTVASRAMTDEAARPWCPMCTRGPATLIATLKDGRTLDIYLCQRCRTRFSYDRQQKSAQLDAPDLRRIVGG